MKRTFSASIVQEGEWYVAQCLEVDVASRGETPDEALQNLREALSPYFELPNSAALPEIRSVEVDIDAA